MTKLRIARSALTCAALLVCATSAPVSSAAEPPTLVGHWKLDEGSGQIALDSSGLGRDGAIVGGSYVTNGLAQITPNGYALSLNGAGGHIAIPDSPDWTLTPSSALTISLWVTLLEDRGVFHVFGKRQGCDGNWFYQLARDGRGFFFMTQGGAVIANRPLAPGWLTHVAVTYDAGQVRLYMDGVLAGSGLAPMSTTPAGPLLVGTSGSCGETQTFPGIVDDLRIYRAALASEQIAELGARQGTVFVPLRPILTWNVRSVNTVLDQQALSAIASVSGTFTYSPGLGSVLPPGPATLNVHFEPEDRSRYSPVDLAIQVIVVEVAVPVARLAMGTYIPMAVDAAKNLLYIAIPYAGESPETLFVIDGNTHTIIDRIAFTQDGEVVNAVGVAVDLPRNRLYVTTGDKRLSVLDATTRKITEIIDLPPAVFDWWGVSTIAVNATTGVVYLPIQESLLIVDPFKPAGAPGRFTVIPVAQGYYCRGIAVNPVHDLVYLGGQQDEGECPLTVVDASPSRPTYHSVVGVLPIREDQLLRAFSVDRRNGKVYVVAWNGSTSSMARLLVIDGAPGRPSFHSITAEISIDLRLGGHATPTNGWIPVFGVAVNPNSNRVYVHTSDPRGDGGDDSLWSIDSATNQTTSLRELPFQIPNGYGVAPVLNSATNRLYFGNGYETLVLEDAVAENRSTVPADGGPVQLTTSSATITFAQVTAPGSTQVQLVAAASLNLTVPGAFAIDGAQAYEVTTTASVVAPITLCFNAWHTDDAGVFAALRVLHGENGALVDRTSSHDFATRTICATVGSLSPFVIARYIEPTYGMVRLYDSAKSFKAGSTAPIRLQITDAAGANLSTASLTVHAIELRLTSTSASSVVVDSGQSNPDQNFRFDAGLGGSGGYIFNLKTTGLSTGSYELRFTVGSGRRQYSVPVQIR